MSMIEDVQKFITCIRCNQVPSQPPLYSCKEGHIICEFCFLESTIGDSKCSHLLYIDFHSNIFIFHFFCDIANIN